MTSIQAFTFAVTAALAMSACTRLSLPDRGGKNNNGNQQLGGAEWIGEEFSTATHVVGHYTSAITVETPAFIHDSSMTNSKYAISVKETVAPSDRRLAITNVQVTQLQSGDAYGAGLYTAGIQGLIVYMANVFIEPNWPAYVDPATTDKDGLMLAGTSQIYAQDLTIKNWNADSAIENRAILSQFVRLTIEGPGHRALKYWNPGPHYIVDSTINNTGTIGEGSLLWIQDCTNFKLNIYNSTFNGHQEIPADKIVCETGMNPLITYLGTDPKVNGEMHPMFRP